MKIALANRNNGIKSIAEAFAAAKQRGRAALIPYICGGYPTAESTVAILLAMQEGGADIIELGVPSSDPFADGETIRESHGIAIGNGTAGVKDCLRIVRDARASGLTVPVILMGYYSSFEEEYDRDLAQMCQDAATSSASGFLAVGIGRGKQEFYFNKICYKYNLSNIPLVLPGSTDQRINTLVSLASTFLYVVSVKGKTGARDALPPELDDAVARVRAKTELPLVVGFGISKPEMVHRVSNISDGAVVGSFLTDCLNKKGVDELDEEVMHRQVSYLNTGSKQSIGATRNQAVILSQVPLHIKEKAVAKSALAVVHPGATPSPSLKQPDKGKRVAIVFPDGSCPLGRDPKRARWARTVSNAA